VYGFGHAAYLEHVVDTVLNDSPSLVDGLEAASRFELITALYICTPSEPATRPAHVIRLRYIGAGA
jgi:hypothetical protein